MGWRAYWAITWGGSGWTAADIVWVIVNDVVEEEEGENWGKPGCLQSQMDPEQCRMSCLFIVWFQTTHSGSVHPPSHAQLSSSYYKHVQTPKATVPDDEQLI